MAELNPPTRPILSITISVTTEADHENLQRGLLNLSKEDPQMRVTADPTGLPTIVSGMGELHLESICDRLRREYKVQLDVGEMNVLYLETIRKPSEGEGKYIRQVGGKGQYAHVLLRLEPLEAGRGYEFVSEIKGESIPERFLKPINQGIQGKLEAGILAAFPMVDLKATVYDGSFDELDSNELTFQIAGSMAFQDAARKAAPVLLEPIMAVQVSSPEEYVGAILGDLDSRRGHLEGMRLDGDVMVITAAVPLAEILGYASQIRALTLGKAEYKMTLARYRVTPPPRESGDEEIGVTANKPKGPHLRSGSAAADFEAGF